MDNVKNYVIIMCDSLKKKLTILSGIILENHKQQMICTADKFDEEAFEATLTRKDEFIEQLDELDSGFDSLYDRIKDELKEHPEEYREEIVQMKQLIADITQKSMEIQLGEKRNESLVMKKLSEARMEIHHTKNVGKAASSYYQNMQGYRESSSQFVDSKK